MTDRSKLLSYAAQHGLLKRLDGRAFCMTGTLSMKRAEIEELIEILGGTVHSQVKQSTSYLLIPDWDVNSSSKFQAASRSGVNVLTEADFCEMILPSVDELLTGGRNDGSEHGSKA